MVEVEEFLHGPAYEVKKDHALFFLDGDNVSHDRIVAIFEAATELTDRVYLVTNSEITGSRVVNIDLDVDPVIRPFLYVPVVQIIPGRLCEDMNIRAITVHNYRFSQKVATKTDK